MTDIVSILEAWPSFSWDQAYDEDVVLPGLVFTTEVEQPGLVDPLLVEVFDEMFDTYISIEVCHGHWKPSAPCVGGSELAVAPSPFLLHQVAEAFRDADYVVDESGMDVLVCVKAHDRPRMWRKYRELRLDERESWRQFQKPLVVGMRRERSRMRIVFGVLKHMMQIARIKQELMEYACHPRRLAQIGLEALECHG